MRILEKLLLLLFSLCLMAVGGVGIWCCFDTNLLKYVNMVATLMTQNRWITLIAAGGLLLVGLLVLFGVVFSTSGKKAADTGRGVVAVGDADSNVQISTNAVDCIIQQLKRSFPEISEMDTRIASATDGVQVLLKVTAAASANFPQMAATLQSTVKEQLESMVGLKVSSVKVIIADVVQTAGAYTPGAAQAAADKAAEAKIEINTEKNNETTDNN